MNKCVADSNIIVNVQGIRNITWGEARYMHDKPWFIQITYKGQNNTFYYKTKKEAYEMFIKIRETMTNIRQEPL